LPQLRRDAAGCTACPLHARATQTVFGAGPSHAKIAFVGEQPGDEEDLSGLPFVGPAGRLLDSILDEAGLDRALIYITNAVKHFKWVPRGKRRMHSKPNHGEIEACKPWLEAEMTAVRPRVIVSLGATAGYAMRGPSFRLTANLGEVLSSPWAKYWLATYHPSALLRLRDHDERVAARKLVVAHLMRARDLAFG
jgi:uracil-DNA glycosylase family protein